jgi:putative lipoic acid-binding regulatory protein
MAMEGVFDKLKAQLEQEEWPNVYLFKFIVPNDSEHIARVYALFGSEADIQSQPSRNGNFVSISVKEMMMDVDSIIAIYEKSAEFKGLIAL